jgi:twitching motility protein PilT
VPPVLREFTRKPRGFVLVTGPTGSGKSTTLAAMIDVINREREDHILTIEDPIEFLHQHKRSIVNQREIGSDADSFSLGLRAALRQDPDVILVGEMRDMETVSTALTAAETGHLVFATLHTQSTAQTVDRIIDVFPPEQQAQVRTQLSVALQGVVTQQLLPTADGQGRVVACEVLVPNPAVRNLIRESKTHQIYSAIQTAGSIGMQTMDADLVRLVRAGKITPELAEQRASVPEELRRLMGGTYGTGGVAGGGMNGNGYGGGAVTNGNGYAQPVGAPPVGAPPGV